MTEWKEILDFPGYFVSRDGQVLSRKTDRILKPATDKDGYKIVTLYNNGKYKKKKVHRLVAKAFISSEIDGLQVNHQDEHPENNGVENLEICTCGYNINYGMRNEKVSKKLSANPHIPKKPVECLDEDGNVLAWYESQHDAGRNGFNRNCVHLCCEAYKNGAIRKHKGLFWRYASELS